MPAEQWIAELERDGFVVVWDFFRKPTWSRRARTSRRSLLARLRTVFTSVTGGFARLLLSTPQIDKVESTVESPAMRILLILLLGSVPLAIAKQPSFRDCKECPEMVKIPPGSFTMGVPKGEEERHKVDEYNRRRSEPMIEIRFTRSFAIGKYEVTVGEYGAFVAQTNYVPPQNDGCWNEYGRPARKTGNARRDNGRNELIASAGWTNPGFPQTTRHPAVCVSWADINAYIGWLRNKSGKGYRLASEAEWEYVARAGTKSAWPWGEDPKYACKYGNVSDKSRVALGIDPAPDSVFQCNDGYTHTAPVGKFRANAFGVHDMIGNVWEVTGDCFNYDLKSTPRDGSPVKKDKCIQMAVRGGSFDIFPWFTRSGYRSRFDLIGGNPRYNYEGFRIARDLSPEEEVSRARPAAKAAH